MDFIRDPLWYYGWVVLYCSSDRSACTPTMTVAWTPLPSSYCFFHEEFYLLSVLSYGLHPII
jgi:hypothetical protein